MPPIAMEYDPPDLAVPLPLAKLPPSPPADADPPRVDKAKVMELVLSDTDSFTDSIPSSPDLDIDLDIEPEILCKIQQKLEHLVKLYNAGKALFPRRLLADLDAQIDKGVDEVTIEDLDGVRQNFSLKIPEWCVDFGRTTYRIGYSSVQNLTCIHPSFPEISLREQTPVSICYTSLAELYPKGSLPEVQTAFAENVKQWEESQTCEELTRNLRDLIKKGKLGKRIKKIVGFGLGSMCSLEDEFHVVRAHAQHAAVRTMARALSESLPDSGKGDGCKHVQIRNKTTPNTLYGAEDSEIKCYVQDPAYEDVDEALLRNIGIEPLVDPKGFLEVDEHTLVFSVSPNVPVKQIVADVQWPGAMIWNTVYADDKDARWEKKVRDGEEFWVVPFTTDPDSPRVRRMAQQYTSVPLHDSNDYFGDLTIYVK